MIWYDLKNLNRHQKLSLTHKSAICIVWKSLNILACLGWAADEKLWKLCNSVNHKYFIKGLKSLNLDKNQGRGRVMNRSEDTECCISLWWKTSCIALFSFLGSVIMRFVCFLRSNGHAKRTSQNGADSYQTVQVVYCANRCFPDRKYASAKLWTEVGGRGGVGWWKFTQVMGERTVQ